MSATTNFIDSFLRYRIINHASFWIATILLLTYYGSLFGGNFQDNLINMIALLPIQMMAAYLMVYVQISKWLLKGLWIRFTLSLTLIAYLLATLARLSVLHIAEPLIGIDSIEESLWEIISDPIYLIKVYMAAIYIPAFLLFLIKMTKERFVQQNHLISLENEKRSAELNFLKAQMNPHFLFNTLNNIYALAKSKSEQTPEMIMRLSEILDYTIYECGETTVPVAKEWQLIENYVDLQALRHSDHLMVVIDQDIDHQNARIAPLILISLVENAFKYALRRPQNDPNIKISLKVEQNSLTFHVFNTRSEKGIKEVSHKKRIGVQNVNRQLELQYPGRHAMNIKDEPGSYDVKLSIQL